MQKITISSLESFCQIETDNSQLDLELLSERTNYFVERTIPEGQVHPDGQFYQSRIKVVDSKDYSIDEKYPYFNVNCPQTNSFDLVALSNYLLERSRQEQGVYNLHASTISKKDRAILIHGPSKSGKTLISLGINGNNGLTFLRNERALIDLENGTFLGGCKKLNVEKYHQEMFPYLQGKNSLLLNPAISKPMGIQGIIYPTIDSGQKKLIAERWEVQKADWILFPELSSVIRGVNRRMFDFTYQLESLDNKELSAERIRKLNKFLQEVPFYFVKGCLEDISSFIGGLFD